MSIGVRHKLINDVEWEDARSGETVTLSRAPYITSAIQRQSAPWRPHTAGSQPPCPAQFRRIAVHTTAITKGSSTPTFLHFDFGATETEPGSAAGSRIGVGIPAVLVRTGPQRTSDWRRFSGVVVGVNRGAVVGGEQRQ